MDDDEKKDNRVSTLGKDESVIAELLQQLNQAGALQRHIMTVERVSALFGVPFATVNSWTSRRETSPHYLPVIEGITNKERLVFLADFLRCYSNWKPRTKKDTDPALDSGDSEDEENVD